MSRRHEQTFFQRRYTDGQQAHGKILNITNHQRKANQNHNEIYLIPVRMAIIKMSTNNKCWRGCREERTLLHCSWECNLVQPLWRTVWRFLKKLKIELPDDLAIPLLSIYLKKIYNSKRYIQKDIFILTQKDIFILYIHYASWIFMNSFNLECIYHCTTTYNSQDMEAT